MNLRNIMIAVTLLAVLTVTLSLTACNTWEGAGKDVEKTGEAMQGE